MAQAVGSIMPKGTEPFKVVLENENVAAWMCVNNAFNLEWNTEIDPKDYWNGFFIQLGRYWRAEDGQLMAGFNKLEFRSGGSPIGYLTNADFEGRKITWINVVAKTGTNSKSDPVDVVNFRNLNAGRLTTQGGEFVPAKSLHHYFEPYPGGITIWHPDQFTVNVKGTPRYEEDATVPHSEYTFILQREEMKFDIQIRQLTHENNNHVWKWLESPRVDGPGGAKDPVWSTTKSTLQGFDEIAVIDGWKAQKEIHKNPPPPPPSGG